MPRNGTGTFSLVSGNPVVSGTTIESNWANTTLSDIATTLTDSLSRSGQGGMTAALRIADGTQGAPGVGFANETGSGFYRAGTGEVWAVVQGAQTLNLDANGVYVPADKTTTVDGAFVFNEAGADKDARFEGDTDANLLFTDASTDRVGIGTATPASKLDVVGDLTVSGAVNAGSVNATTLDLTNIEVTNIKAKDGTASASIADSTGVMSLVANPVLSGGTANGVLYLNGSKVATSGSALTFDGTTLSALTSGTSIYFSGGDSSVGRRLQLYATSTTNTGDTQNINALGSTGVLAFALNSSEQMRLTSTGLGIGTSSPQKKLVVSDAGAVGMEWSPTDNPGSMRQLAYNRSTSAYVPLRTEASQHEWYASSSEAMRLDSSGNIGLGVTPSAWSGIVGLQFGPLGAVSSSTSAGTVMSYNAFASSAGWAAKYISNGTASIYEQYAGAHYWLTAPSGTAGDAISFTQAMTLDADGDLGIGVTSPGTRLDLESSGSRVIDINSTNVAGSGIRFKNSSTINGYVGSAKYIVSGGALADFGIDVSGANNLIFGTNDTERARITSGGVLGVGCDPLAIWPTATSASGDNGSTVFKTYTSISSNASVLQYLNRNDADGTITQYYRSGTAVGSVSVTSTATAYNTSSDYRLKDNQQPLTNSGAFIDALQPKTWEWKADGSRGVGFIAHEVQAVSPGSVVGDKDAVDADGKPVMQAMEYGSAEFIANIIAELKSLRARVAALEAQP